MTSEQRTTPEGAGAGRDTTTEQPPDTISQVADQDDPGFFAKAGSGKVRPLPREPETTHYRSRRSA